MSEELTKKLIEYLNNSEVFIKEQAPDYINQVLAYGVWDAQFGLMICVPLTLLGIVLLVLAATELRDEASFIAFILGVGMFIVGGTLSGCNYSKLKQIELAPKVYLLKQITGKCE